MTVYKCAYTSSQCKLLRWMCNLVLPISTSSPIQLLQTVTATQQSRFLCATLQSMSDFFTSQSYLLIPKQQHWQTEQNNHVITTVI